MKFIFKKSLKFLILLYLNQIIVKSNDCKILENVFHILGSDLQSFDTNKKITNCCFFSDVTCEIINNENHITLIHFNNNNFNKSNFPKAINEIKKLKYLKYNEIKELSNLEIKNNEIYNIPEYANNTNRNENNESNESNNSKNDVTLKNGQFKEYVNNKYKRSFEDFPKEILKFYIIGIIVFVILFIVLVIFITIAIKKIVKEEDKRAERRNKRKQLKEELDRKALIDNINMMNNKMTNNNTTAKNNNMISTPVPNNNVMSNNIISNAIPSNYVVYQPPPPQLVILNSYPTPTNSVLPTSNLLVTTPVSTGAPSPSLSVANEPSNSQRNSFHSAPRIVSDNTTDSNADELPPYSLIENDVDENNSTNTNLNSNVTPTNATQLATIAQNQQQQSNSSHSTTNNNNNDTFLTLPEQQIIRPVLPQVTRPPIINAHPPQVIMASTSRNDQQNMLRPVIPMQSWIKKP